jgi:DNA-binding transcriptional MocR family regulator
MNGTISAPRVVALIGDFDRFPAYNGIAVALRLLIGDGRIPINTRLPSERELTKALKVSRTTITRAYAVLSSTGYAEARQGAGTFTTMPGGRYRVRDNALVPYVGDENAIDLNCAAASAPPGIAAAYGSAIEELPMHLGSHGYFPTGLPVLQAAIAATYDARGLPTQPDQIMVTSGALTATAIVAQALTGQRDRVLVETPGYPNAVQALRQNGARLLPSPVDPDGWDLAGIGATLQQSRPKLAYLIPDFHNPTGNLMSEEQRAEYARYLTATRTIPVVDEAHQLLALDGQPMPQPFASFAPQAITIGSASKSFWGGLRLGWIRSEGHMAALISSRVGFDLGAPVLEQLVLAKLLTGPDTVLANHRARLRSQRDRLATAITTLLPDWRFQLPTGGLSLWCELPRRGATSVVAEAEQLGLILAPGPVFAAEGGLDRFIRIPFTLPGDQLEEATLRLAKAWALVGRGAEPRPRIRVA